MDLSILWRSGDHAKEAAEALKLTAQDLKPFGVIDEIIIEPLGGAHRDPDVALNNLGDAMETALDDISGLDPQILLNQRRAKFLNIGKNGLS